MTLAAPVAALPELLPGESYEQFLRRYAFDLEIANDQAWRDPLQHFGWPGEPHRAACRYHSQGLETALRGSNDAGKTRTGAAIVVATLQGKKTLAGEPLPKVEMPATWWVLVQTYKQQVDASQAAVLDWLGGWPYKDVLGPKGYVEHIWIKTPLCTHSTEEMHRPGWRCRTCSKLVFHCAESDSGTGGKVDGAWADEPPLEKTWRELRRRGKGNRVFYKLITFTPIEKYWWHWMPGDFNGTEHKPRNGRVEVRATMDDNRFILPDVKAQKIADTAGDEYAAARLSGDYVDIVGDCPFQPPSLLEHWMRRTHEPLRLEQFTVTAQRKSQQGIETMAVRCNVRIDAEPEPDEFYIGVIDPSMFLFIDPQTGLVSEKALSSSRQRHAPVGLHIYGCRRPHLAVRFRAYSGAYGVGSLAAQLAERYNNTLFHVDLTGGYGDPTIQALTKAGYYNFTRGEFHAQDLGQMTGSPGFKMTAINRAGMQSAIQQALVEDSVAIYSPDVVLALMQAKVETLPGGTQRWTPGEAGNEDVVCLGQFLMLAATPGLVPPLTEEQHVRGYLPWLASGSLDPPRDDDGLERPPPD